MEKRLWTKMSINLDLNSVIIEDIVDI